MFGVALGGIQMRFELAGFLGQRVEAGDEGLLFGEGWERNLNYPHLLHAQSAIAPCTTGRGLQHLLAPFWSRGQVQLQEGGIGSCRIDHTGHESMRPKATNIFR